MTVDAAVARIRDYAESDFEAVEALWRKAGNFRPWNDPAKDIALCLKTPTSALYVAEADDMLVGTVMVGHDGHRGWVYYLAVDPDLQRNGLGRRLMRHAENWLKQAGLPKVQLMVRTDNAPVLAFYGALDYADAKVATLEKWFDAEATKLKKKAYDASLEVTTTYLEMTARPPLPSFATPKNAALMRVREPSTAFYRYLYNAVGEDWLWYERRSLSDDALNAIIGDEQVEIYVLYQDGEPVGYGELDRRQADAVELAYFGLMPQAVGKGLGVWLLTELIDLAWSYEPARFWVHTCTLDHPRALPLYQRAGFVPYKQETNTIPDPRHTGLFNTTDG